MTKAKDRANRSGSDPIIVGNTRLETDSNNDLVVKDTSDNAKKVIASEVHVGTGSDKVILKRSSTDGKLQLQTTDGSSATNSTVSGESGGAGGVTVQEEGSTLSTTATALNFVGSTVTASGTGATKTITISAGSGGTTTVYANIAAMVATSPSAGDQALVTANKGLYIFNGNGWYKIATVNTSPTLVSPASGTDVTLSSEGTATTIELVGADADEGTTLQYSYAVTSGSLTNGGGTTATVTSSATSNGTYSALAAGASTTNRFIKITPSSNSSYAGNFSLNFAISDGTNAATTLQNFGLAFEVSGSLYFDGTGDYIEIADSDDWHFGTGDFTLEAWIWSYSFANGYNGIIAQWPQNGGNANNSFVLETVGSNLNFYTVHGGTTLTSHTGSTTIDLYKWYHVAVVRSSGIIKSYINGLEDFSVSNNNNFNNPSSPLTVGGGVVGTGGSWNGYISNARIVKGTAVYTPTSPNAGSSASASYGMLQTPASLPSWGTTWTIETWIYITNSASYNTFFHGFGGTYNYIARVGNSIEVNGLGGYTTSGGGASVTWNLNQWYHVAVSCSSTSAKVFVNGVQVSSGTAASAPHSGGSGTLSMMAQGGNTWPTLGYMSDTRLVIGTSVYSGAFTPPSGPLTKTGGTYPSTTNVNTSFPAAHTYLLTNRTTSGTTIADDSDQNYTMVTSGSLTGSTTRPYSDYFTVPTSPLSPVTNTKLLVAKDNTPVNVTDGSYLFNGTSENLLVEHSDMALRTEDWTIDFWFKLLANTSGNSWLLFFGPSNGTDNTESIHVYFPANRQLTFWDFSGGGFYGLLGVPTNNVWYHVRYVRHGLNHYQFLNGNCYEAYASGNSSASGNIITTGQSFVAGNNYDQNPASNAALRIGGGYSGGYGLGNGLLLSNLRVVKGTALNTNATGFSPPTAPLTAVSNTKLLTAQNGTGNPTVDNSGTSKTISIAQGTPTTDARNVQLATTDQSSSSRSVSEYGNTAFNYATPFENASGGSFYFSGNSNNVLKTGSNADFTLGTGDFTIEGWVYYLGGGSNNNGFWQVGGNNANGFGSNYTTSVSLGLAGATTLKLYGAGGEYAFGVANAAVANTWVHYAMTKTSSTIKIYKDGTQIYTRSDTTNYSGSYLGLGAMYGPNQTPNFYLSNFRVIKGTAVYTGNFTAPTGNLTPTGGTYSSTTNVNTSIPSGQCSVLTAITSNSFTDISGNNHVITGVGDPIATKFMPY